MWGSWSNFKDIVSKTLQTAEQHIDRIVGIPEQPQAGSASTTATKDANTAGSFAQRTQKEKISHEESSPVITANQVGLQREEVNNKPAESSRLRDLQPDEESATESSGWEDADFTKGTPASMVNTGSPTTETALQQESDVTPVPDSNASEQTHGALQPPVPSDKDYETGSTLSDESIDTKTSAIDTDSTHTSVQVDASERASIDSIAAASITATGPYSPSTSTSTLERVAESDDLSSTYSDMPDEQSVSASEKGKDDYSSREEESTHSQTPDENSKEAIITDQSLQSTTNPPPTPSITSQSQTEPDIVLLQSRVKYLEDLVAQRENQLAERTHQYALLLEENQTLKETIEKSRNSDKQSTVDALTEEFSQRLAAMERKYQAAIKEKEMLKKQLEKQIDLTGDLSKDKQIEELRYEGEQLQKKVIQLEETTKKLRAAKKEQTKVQEQLKSELESTTAKLAAATSRLQHLTETEKKLEQVISDMKAAAQANAKQLEEALNSAKSNSEKAVELQKALDAAWNEISLLKKREQELIASHEAKLREIESKQRDEYLEALQTQVAADAKKEDALRQTIQELQAALENAQEIATQREEEYQRRIEALQSQIEEMEARAGSASVVSVAATKPLLRQIAELQEQLSSKDQTYQTLEKSLRARIAEEERKAVALQQERDELKEQVEQLRKQLSAMRATVDMHESKLASLRKDYENQSAMLSEMKAKLAVAHEEINTADKRLADTTTERDEALKSIKRLQTQLDEKEQQLQAQLLINKQLISQRISTQYPSTSPTKPEGANKSESSSTHGPVTPSSSVSSSPKTLSRQNSENEVSVLLQAMSLGEQSAAKLSSLSVEMLQSLVLQREGEAKQLHAYIDKLSSQKRQLQSELMKLNMQMEKLQLQIKGYEVMAQEKRELEERYLAALEMLGERAEKVDEIQADMTEWKALYKTQIAELCQQIEQLKKENAALQQKLSGTKQ